MEVIGFTHKPLYLQKDTLIPFEETRRALHPVLDVMVKRKISVHARNETHPVSLLTTSAPSCKSE
jgi:hypothetical protein